MSSPTIQKSKRKREIEGGDAVASFEVFRVRVRAFSLGFLEIRPSEFFGARGKVVLCGEA